MYSHLKLPRIVDSKYQKPIRPDQPFRPSDLAPVCAVHLADFAMSVLRGCGFGVEGHPLLLISAAT